MQKQNVENQIDKIQEVTEYKLKCPGAMTSIKVLEQEKFRYEILLIFMLMVNLKINVNVSELVISDFIKWFRVLQVLDQIRDSVVVGEFVQNIGHVERCSLNN